MKNTYIPKYGKSICKVLVGSHAYGTNIETSDYDYKGIYMQDASDIIGYYYKEQYEETKDETYFELKRFLTLISIANPTTLELLFLPEDCVLSTSEQFRYLQKIRDQFITTKCFDSFGGYAVAQLQKAKGLNKKMNWESSRMQRKTPIDFMYIIHKDTLYNLRVYLEKNTIEVERIGFSKIGHFDNSYLMYITDDNEINFKGIETYDKSDIAVSSIPKGMNSIGVVYFNKNSWSQHCKDWNQYNTWLEERNTSRYVDIKNHNQRIDGKNLMHARRLLDMALEIAEKGTLTIKRKNSDYLLSIRRGDQNLESIIETAEEDLLLLDDLKKRSTLSNTMSTEYLHKLLLTLREM